MNTLLVKENEKTIRVLNDIKDELEKNLGRINFTQFAKEHNISRKIFTSLIELEFMPIIKGSKNSRKGRVYRDQIPKNPSPAFALLLNSHMKSKTNNPKKISHTPQESPQIATLHTHEEHKSEIRENLPIFPIRQYGLIGGFLKFLWR